MANSKPTQAHAAQQEPDSARLERIKASYLDYRGRQRPGNLKKADVDWLFEAAASRNDLLAACEDVESKIVDFIAGRINWRPDDFLYRVRAAIAKAKAGDA